MQSEVNIHFTNHGLLFIMMSVLRVGEKGIKLIKNE